MIVTQNDADKIDSTYMALEHLISHLNLSENEISEEHIG